MNYIYQDVPGIGKVRLYLREDGSKLLGVTSILSFEPASKWIQIWKNRVGTEEFERVMKKAADRWTAIHAVAENYFLKNFKPIPTDFDLQVFINGFYTFISREWASISEALFLEKQFFFPELWYGWAVDAGLIYKNIPCLFDWKTSNGSLSSDLEKKYRKQTSMYVMGYNFLNPDNPIWDVYIPVFTAKRKDGYAGMIYMWKEEIIATFKEVIPTIIIANVTMGLPTPNINLLEWLCYS